MEPAPRQLKREGQHDRPRWPGVRCSRNHSRSCAKERAGLSPLPGGASGGVGCACRPERAAAHPRPARAAIAAVIE